MRTEVPEVKRCCFCIPLRCGLIIWGYFKIITSLLAFSLACAIIKDTLKMLQSEKDSYRVDTFYLGITCFAGIVVVVDFVLTIVYIVGCHKKNVKILRIYYFYSSVLLALTTTLSLYSIYESSRSVYLFWKYHKIEIGGLVLSLCMSEIMDALAQFANVALQIYILVLLRNEINKLNDMSEFKFVNHAAGAECTLNINNKNDGPETYKKNQHEDDDDEIKYA